MTKKSVYRAAQHFQRDIKEQVQGKLDQAAGTAQDLYGQTAEVARDTAVTFEKWLRPTIETKPYWWSRSASPG
jgi:hypothetical protein